MSNVRKTHSAMLPMAPLSANSERGHAALLRGGELKKVRHFKVDITGRLNKHCGTNSY